MTQNKILTEGKVVAKAITDHIEGETDICLNPYYLEAVNDILRIHARCDAQTFHDGHTGQDTGPNDPLPDQLIHWLNNEADDMRPFIRGHKVFLEQSFAWVPAATGAILEIAIDGVALFADEIAELVDEISKGVNEITNTPEYRASFAAGQAGAKAIDVFVKNFTAYVKDTTAGFARKSGNGIERARQFLNEVRSNLKQLFNEIKALLPLAKQAGERILTRISNIDIPQNLKGDDYGIGKASAFLSEVDDIAREELGKLPIGTQTARYMEKFSKAFTWISVGAAINTVMQSDNKVRQALMEAAALGVGFGITAFFAFILLPVGPVLFPPLFIACSGIASYYGTEATKEIVGAIYDWVMEGKPPAIIAD